MAAVVRHGVLWGAALAVWRVLRCNPFGRGGFDPVPGTYPRRTPSRLWSNPTLASAQMTPAIYHKMWLQAHLPRFHDYCVPSSLR
jgi:hypothetical protein